MRDPVAPSAPPASDVIKRAGAAECLASQKKFDEARIAYQAIEHDYPDFPNLHYAFGRFFDQRSRHSRRHCRITTRDQCGHLTTHLPACGSRRPSTKSIPPVVFPTPKQLSKSTHACRSLTTFTDCCCSIPTIFAAPYLNWNAPKEACQVCREFIRLSPPLTHARDVTRMPPAPALPSSAITIPRPLLIPAAPQP